MSGINRFRYKFVRYNMAYYIIQGKLNGLEILYKYSRIVWGYIIVANYIIGWGIIRVGSISFNIVPLCVCVCVCVLEGKGRGKGLEWNGSKMVL